jgi:hypothetical protein
MSLLERLRKCFLDFETLILIEVIKNYCFCIIYGASFALREGTSDIFFKMSNTAPQSLTSEEKFQVRKKVIRIT